MKKKHILVIAQYFYPEQFRINDICEEWIKRGYQVTVLTGIPNYPRGKFYSGYGLLKKRYEIHKEIEIIRIPIVPRGHNSLMLVMNYLSFVISGLIWKTFTKIKPDFVFIYEVSPMTQALPGVWFTKKRRIPCYLYVTDLWPDSVEVAAGITNKVIINILDCIVNYIYKHCEKIFTASESIMKVINERGVPFEKLEFWPQYAEDYYKPIGRDKANVPEIVNDGKLNLIFAGNIGVAQGLNILPDVAKILKQREIQVRFIIVGDGRYKETLQKKVKDNQVDEFFCFINKQPAIRIPEFMAVCDATLISLSKSKLFTITLPSKVQSCLACGIPIIASADGEIQNVISRSKAGLCSAAADVNRLVENIEKFVDLSSDERLMMAAYAEEYNNINYNKETLLKRLDKYFL